VECIECPENLFHWTVKLLTPMPNRTIKPSHGNQRFDQPYVIVIALDSLAGLQTARIFHDRGVPVIGIAQDPRHWACKTNACEKIVASRLDSQELVSTLQTIGPELGQRAVLVPCSDISVATVSTNRALLTEWFHIRLPAHRTVATLASKRGFVDFANTHGLPIPQSYIIRNRDDATAAADCIPYPCVIKPTRRSEAWDKGVRAKALKVGSRSEFMSIYEQVHLCTDTLIAQEWIEGTNGDLFSCNCYYDRASRPLVTFVARKIRQWPPIVGISSLGEEVRNDTVLQQALKLFEAANYEGLGYVEIKQDA
jgi:predicted ATP-grasp superfamily ATP-dependent carboligase